jgi:hypothetical protein
MPLIESQNFLNDLVTDSPHLCRAKSAHALAKHGSSRRAKERPLDELEVEGIKLFERGEGSGRGRGRGRGNRGGRGLTSSNIGQICSNTIVGGLTPQKRKRH